VWVHELADADPSCGGKARGLARLSAAGLPVPPGFAIDDRAFRDAAGALDAPLAELGHALAEAAARIERAELPAELVAEVSARAAALGPELAVRSSATIEDGEAGAAAGVFSSRRAVPAGEVWAAIRAVWASALTPLAAAYARRRGAAIAIGVIVQRFVEGERVTVYTRPPGDPAGDAIVVQRGGALARLARGDRDPIAALALAAEAAIGAARGADVELIAGDRLWLVQARPIVHPAPRAFVPVPGPVLAPLRDGRVWTWDIAHNPDPLSPAQQGLVERVDAAGAAPWSLRLCAGFLYSAPRAGAPPPVAGDRDELAARARAIEARLRALLDAPVEGLADAVARYVACYAIWAGELSPLVAAARAAAGPALAGAARPGAIETTLLAAARGELAIADVERALGVLAPAWDVAVATFGEQPGLVRDAVARAALAPAPSRPAREATLAELASELAERDDLLFAEAQWLVRRALLARAEELELGRDDIFWLPLDAALAGLDRDDAHRRASASRAAAARAARWQMPVVVGGAPHTAERVALHGIGTGPRVVGRVVRFASLASAIAVGAGDVVVTRAVTPALAVLVAGCAALVSETGGLLDHGAALARELGIPCVVGCHDAWTQLSDGMLVTVDGDAGVVSRT